MNPRYMELIKTVPGPTINQQINVVVVVVVVVVMFALIYCHAESNVIWLT